jgi:hypothetical protein
MSTPAPKPIGKTPDGREIYATQDPKYVIINNQLCNSATYEPIPQDEPLMMFRGKDRKALATVYDYAQRVEDPQHQNAVMGRAKAFEDFRLANPNRMKEPDTKV